MLSKQKKLERHVKKHPSDTQALSSDPVNYGKQDLSKISLTNQRWKLYLKSEV